MMTEGKTDTRPGQYLTFNLSNNTYAIPIQAVREINRVGAITKVPKSSRFIAGVVDLRGRVIPVIDLRLRLGMEFAAQTQHSCIVIIDSSTGQIGMIVDSVNSVVDISDQQIQPKPTVGALSDTTFMTGMANVEGKILVLLDTAECSAGSALEGLTAAS